MYRPINLIGSVERWFDTSVFTPVAGFGNLGRNVVIGPGFNNTDFSITKNTTLGERLSAQFRVEFFDLFNHANLGQLATSLAPRLRPYHQNALRNRRVRVVAAGAAGCKTGL
jgi:hypothetical protein